MNRASGPPCRRAGGPGGALPAGRRRHPRTWALVLAALLAACGGAGEGEPARAEASVPEPERVVVPPEPVAPEPGGVELLATLPVGRNPQQIAFSPDGATAYVAAARSNRVTVVDARSYLISGSLDAPGIPIGVAVLPGSGDVLVSLFKGARIERLDPATGRSVARLETGKGPSFLVGPLPGGTFLVSNERDKRVLLVDGDHLSVVASFPTGDRPFPPAVTSDGRLAFVASYVQGTIAVVDLENQMLQALIPVGKGPSGGAVLPGDRQLAVAVREENRIAILDIRSRKEVASLKDGIGLYPFSVVISPDGRLAFVNNNQSNDVSVIALPELRVMDRIPVGEIPSAVAVHPSGDTLWVSCEGDHQLYILRIPPQWRAVAAPPYGIPGAG